MAAGDIMMFARAYASLAARGALRSVRSLSCRAALLAPQDGGINAQRLWENVWMSLGINVGCPSKIAHEQLLQIAMLAQVD